MCVLVWLGIKFSKEKLGIEINNVFNISIDKLKKCKKNLLIQLDDISENNLIKCNRLRNELNNDLKNIKRTKEFVIKKSFNNFNKLNDNNIINQYIDHNDNNNNDNDSDDDN